MATQREASRNNWTSADTIRDIDSGSLQRIADACELMAQSHQKLLTERERYERMYRRERATRQETERSLRSQKGVSTRLRRQLQELRDAL